jgi:hypothetical protein
MELITKLFTPDFAVIFIIGFLGMLTHFFSKKIKGETGTEILRYFHDNTKSTIMALIATFIGTAAYYLALGTGVTADLVNAFTIGFTFDSILNKWEATGAKIKE